MGTNMLSAKKVKLHGIQDSRWTVYDHLTQYKGLVRLFERDRKIIDIDNKLNTKRNKKEIKMTLKEIFGKRQELENWNSGDRQQIRNLLGEYRTMKLAYQDLHVTKIIDHIYQDNFSKRKMLDLLQYRLKLKIDKLIKLRIEEGELENQVQLDFQGKTALQVQIGIVTGKVQDMILKKEAAITVKTTYKTLVDLMKKDAIYYDAVLNTLREDGYAQGHCIIQATKLGQLATEYLDDRKVEFQTLQAAVKNDLKMRTKDLQIVRAQIEDTVKNLRGLIRRDSDITVTALPPLNNSKSFVILNENIQELNGVLSFLKDVTLVSNFENIFPCMQDQANQSTRLMELVKKHEDNKELLEKKRDHAQVIATNLKNTMNETTFEYKENKHNLLEKIKEQQERNRNVKETIERRGRLLTEIRKVLQSLQHVTSKVTTDVPKKQGGLLKAGFGSDMSIVLEPLEEDGLKLVSMVTTKVNALTKIGFDELDKMPLEADIVYNKLILESSKFLDLTSQTVDADLLEGIMFEDVQIPTRDFIKEQSKDIVYAATRAEI